MSDRKISLIVVGAMVALFWLWNVRAQQPSTLQPTTSGPMVGACNPGQGIVISTSGTIYSCYLGTWAAISPMSGTTGSIGGSLLASVGAATTGTITIQGASVGQPCIATASDGTNMLAIGFMVHCDVTTANTVTVTVAALIIGTPTSKTYFVRIP
jgi:hypothetical protein